MVELSHRDRTIKVKIVYYGPPVGGKTTNLQVLHRHADAARRGEMVSVNSAQDRTILFDLLPLKTPGFRGFDLRLQLLAVPGQAMYAATRRLVLKGADAVVFVANSATDRWEENLQSYREMTQNLLTHHLDPSTLPLVFQYNKRDLPQVTDTEILNRALNGRKVEAIPAVALKGEGVLETFSAILHQTMQDLARRYSILDRGDGQPAWQWTQNAVLGLFGSTSIAEEAMSDEDLSAPKRSVSLRPMPPLQPATPSATAGLPPPPGAGMPRLDRPTPAVPQSSPALPTPVSGTPKTELESPRASVPPPAKPASAPREAVAPQAGPTRRGERGTYEPSAALRSAFGETTEPQSHGLLYFEEDIEDEAGEPPQAPEPPTPEGESVRSENRGGGPELVFWEEEIAPDPAATVATPAAGTPVARAVEGTEVAASQVPGSPAIPPGPTDEAIAVWTEFEPPPPAPPIAPRPLAFEGVAEDVRPIFVERPQTIVRVTPQPTDSLISLDEDKASTALVESYAEASSQLGSALAEMREQRDLALAHLEDLRRSVEAARGIAAGEPLADAAQPILERMSGSIEGHQASLLLPKRDGGFEATALRSLLRDPVLASPAALAALEEAVGVQASPVLLEGSTLPTIAAVISRGDPPFDGIVAVPLRTPRGLFGLALLYLTADAARPGAATLTHLEELGRAVGISLELASALDHVRQSGRALEMALAGSASSHGLEGLVTALVDLRNRLGEMRRRPDAPPWFLEEFTRCGPSLSSALEVARSLIAFSKGEIQREPVVLADLLTEIESESVSIEASGQEQVLADPGLLRVALRALVEHVGRGTSAVVVQVAPAPGRVLIGVGLREAANQEPAPPAGDSLGLALVRRIAVLHGGSLEVESIPGGAEWVFLSLPPA